MNVSPVGKGDIREFTYEAGSTSIIDKDVTPVTYPNTATCYNINSSIWLQAKPISGWKFNGWSGDSNSLATLINIKLPSSIKITTVVVANFKELPPPDPNSIDNDMDGYSELQGDCNDINFAVHPGALEVCGDNIDNDCSSGDEVCRENIDMDKDCFTPSIGDCDDNNPAINPGMIDICEDGIDNDCNGFDLICASPIDPATIDHDGDKCSIANGDCDDVDVTIFPGAEEIPNDGIDQDCNGSDLIVIDPNDIDNDKDGFTVNQGDCNDTDAGINPNVIDVCGNGLDEDCSGVDTVCAVPSPKKKDDNCFINTLR